MMTVGSLFSGIGGLDLGFERAGMTVAWQCEIDKAASTVLARHWPDVPNMGDVRDVGHSTPSVDVVVGGFPRQ
jgi:DNA (cytosine-5)-methyltransferase 1